MFYFWGYTRFRWILWPLCSFTNHLQCRSTKAYNLKETLCPLTRREEKGKKNWAGQIKPEIISVSVALVVSITRWVSACDMVAKGIPSPIKSVDTLFGWVGVGRDRRQAIFPVQPGVSHTGQTEVNVLVQHAPTRHSFVVGGKKDHMAVKCDDKPARRCCPVCPAGWKSNVDSTMFRTMDRGQWEWFDLQQCGPCVCFFFFKILFTITFAFKRTYLIAKTPVFNLWLIVQLQCETTVFCLGAPDATRTAPLQRISAFYTNDQWRKQ